MSWRPLGSSLWSDGGEIVRPPPKKTFESVERKLTLVTMCWFPYIGNQVFDSGQYRNRRTLD